MTLSVTDTTFQSEVLEAAEPVLVDFWATWCGPCRQIAPALDEIATELSGRLKVVKVDVDQNPAMATKYNVRSIPTLLLFKGGEVVGQHFGAAPKAKLQQFATSAL